VLQKAELSCEADSENYLGGSSETMYYIGLDVHKRTISYCVKDAAGRVHMEGKIGSTRARQPLRGRRTGSTQDAYCPGRILALLAETPCGNPLTSMSVFMTCGKHQIFDQEIYG